MTVFPGVVTSESSPQVRAMLRETAKNPRAASQTLRASVSMLNHSKSKSKIHHSTVKKRMNNYGLFGKFVRRKPLLSKKNMAAQLGFAKVDLYKPQDFWNNVLWRDETKVEIQPGDLDTLQLLSPP